MNWIRDVQKEIRELDVSRKKLRNFGLQVGPVLMLLAGFSAYRKGFGPVSMSVMTIGLILIFCGWVAPVALLFPYKLWMGTVFTIGWPIARLILSILFYLVITPIALVARLFRVRFLELDNSEKRTTFWVPRKKSAAKDYEKMF